MTNVIPDADIAGVAAYAFGDLGSNVVIQMTAIALAESSGDADALSPGARSGGAGGYGLWQIENNHPEFGADFYTTGYKVPIMNAVAARVIYNQEGIGAWSTSGQGNNPDKNSSYAQFMSRAQAAMNQPMSGGYIPGASGTPANVPSLKATDGGMFAAIGSPAGVDNSLGALLNSLNGGGPGGASGTTGGGTGTSTGLFTGLGPTLWIGGGAILVVLAIVMLAKNEVNPVKLASKVLS